MREKNGKWTDQAGGRSKRRIGDRQLDSSAKKAEAGTSLLSAEAKMDTRGDGGTPFLGLVDCEAKRMVGCLSDFFWRMMRLRLLLSRDGSKEPRRSDLRDPRQKGISQPGFAFQRSLRVDCSLRSGVGNESKLKLK